jgi:hypothetical protein
MIVITILFMTYPLKFTSSSTNRIPIFVISFKISPLVGRSASQSFTFINRWFFCNNGRFYMTSLFKALSFWSKLNIITKSDKMKNKAYYIIPAIFFIKEGFLEPV